MGSPSDAAAVSATEPNRCGQDVFRAPTRSLGTVGSRFSSTFPWERAAGGRGSPPLWPSGPPAGAVAFLAGLLGMAWLAGCLPVGEVELGSAFSDRGDVVCGCAYPCAARALDAAQVVVSVEYLCCPCPVCSGGGAWPAAVDPSVCGVVGAVGGAGDEVRAVLLRAFAWGSGHHMLTAVLVQCSRVPVRHALRGWSLGLPSRCAMRVGPSWWSNRLG